MVCPHCGTLNPDHRERCFRCEHSLSPAKVAEEVTCRWHPSITRAANCSVCGAPICEACAIRVGDVAYCPNCAAVPGEERVRVEADSMLSPLQMQTMPCASAGWRFASGLIDGFILGSGAIILAFIVWMLTGVPPGMPWTDGTNALFWAILIVGAGAYFVGYQVSSGETPGYGATDLLLVHQDGRAVTPLTASLRFVVSLFSAAFFMLGYLWMIWDPDSQAWHDKAAGTVVLRTSERKDLTEVEPPNATLEQSPPGS
jgi:uncharacterized RDD family membrane protein YckC